MVKARVRLRDIADYTGSSISTVSAALNGTGRINPEKVRQIRLAAEKLGFKPNLAAQLLKSSNIDIFGLVISDIHDQLSSHNVYSDLLENFMLECQAQNIRTQFELDRSKGVPTMLSDSIAKGVLRSGVINPKLKEWLDKHPDFPFVAFEEPWKYCVRTDFANGIHKALQYLAATGHKRIALSLGPSEYDINKQMLSGFQAGCNDFGIAIKTKLIKHHSYATGMDHYRECAEIIHQFFSGQTKPQAIISTGRGFSAVAMYELPRMGFQIPEDVSLIGGCTGWQAEHTYPGLSSIERNIPQLISGALKILKQLTRKIEPNISQLLIPAEMVVRNTTIPRL